MGAQMTKELGLYNEEEKVCTPLGPQRYRMLQSDPRSATRGIVRTPIQVACTPRKAQVVEPVVQNISVDKSETSLTKVSEEVDCCEKDKMDVNTEEEVVEVSEELSVKPPYLETNIDSPLAAACVKELEDVRSPTLNLARTPVLVECTPELFTLHSRINNLSFCDLDDPTDDPSVIVSDDEQASLHNRSHINNWLVAVDNVPGAESPGFNSSFADSPKTVAKKQKELNSMKKQLFFTPDVKELVKPKARTPLGDIQQGSLRDSPQKMMRVKQWRNIQEERQRLGITDTENTPPNLPPLSKVASAPGKIIVKRTKINWDEDNTLVI